MNAITVSTTTKPDTLALGIKWRKWDGLYYISAVEFVCNPSDPMENVRTLRLLADKIEQEINR